MAKATKRRAAEVLLEGEPSKEILEMKKAANIDIKAKLKDSIDTVLKRQTDLSLEKIEEVSESIVLRYIDSL